MANQRNLSLLCPTEKQCAVGWSSVGRWTPSSSTSTCSSRAFRAVTTSQHKRLRLRHRRSVTTAPPPRLSCILKWNPWTVSSNQRPVTGLTRTKVVRKCPTLFQPLCNSMSFRPNLRSSISSFFVLFDSYSPFCLFFNHECFFSISLSFLLLFKSKKKKKKKKKNYFPNFVFNKK